MPSLPTLKKLFALSGNRCAYPECTTPAIKDGSVVVEVCHIRGAKAGAARFDAQQSDAERHGFENLVLLCGVHHKVVDDDEATYTVERMRQMKSEIARQGTRLSATEVQAAAQFVTSQALVSFGQTGGITANIINFTLNTSGENGPVDSLGPPDFSPQPFSLRATSFVSPHGQQIARTKSVDKDGTISEYVYWHNGPGALLRIVPGIPLTLSRAGLERIVSYARHTLRPFGEARHVRTESNSMGATVIGFDGPLPDTIATRIAHVTQKGEIWGLNKAILNARANDPPNTQRLLWPELKSDFHAALASLVQFARHELQLSPPVTVIAGLHSIYGAILTRPKPDWYLGEPAGKRCLEDSIVHCWELTHFEDPFIVPDPFYEKLFDACALTYQDEPNVITWPRKPK